MASFPATQHGQKNIYTGNYSVHIREALTRVELRGPSTSVDGPFAATATSLSVNAETVFI